MTDTHTPYKVVAFYKFVTIENTETVHLGFKAFTKFHNILGTVLVATEGLNGTVAGTADAIDKFVDILKNGFGFTADDYKFSTAVDAPFPKAKVKLKQEIVTLKQPQADPNKMVGQYVSPADWNDLISQDDVIVIDTRNDFEVQMGTFENAVDPLTSCFSQFPDFVKQNLDPKKHKKIAMFCTGGIRCEKASSYMLQAGFENVYHLKGGILKYLEEIPEQNSKWMGDCFVFDKRIALGHGLKEIDK